MQIQDYLSKNNSLALEDLLLKIPFRKEYVLKQIGKGKRVLDVGCLGGKFSKLIQDQNNDLWGIELNPVAATAAEKRGIRVKVANIEDGLPFENAFFDVVNAGEVLDHLYDSRQFFQEANRVLKPTGLFIISTPNLNSLQNRFNIMRGKYLDMSGAYPEDHYGNHIRLFNLAKLEELLHQTGFRIQSVRGLPHTKSHGKILDWSLAAGGKIFPKLSKILIVTARKEKLMVSQK